MALYNSLEESVPPLTRFFFSLSTSLTPSGRLVPAVEEKKKNKKKITGTGEVKVERKSGAGTGGSGGGEWREWWCVWGVRGCREMWTMRRDKPEH